MGERKVQPKTRLQKGWKVSCWIARRKNGRGFSNQDYEKFDFEKEKPDGEMVTKKGQFAKGFALRNANEIKNFCGPMKNVAKMSKRRFHNGRRYEGHETLIRVKGVFIAPQTGTLHFHTNTDDGSYLWLGDFRTNKMIDNGGMHGMRIRDSQMPAKKGEHLPFIFTFYEHHGHGAAYLTAKMGKTVLAPYHYDNRLNKLMGLRKIRKTEEFPRVRESSSRESTERPAKRPDLEEPPRKSSPDLREESLEEREEEVEERSEDSERPRDPREDPPEEPRDPRRELSEEEEERVEESSEEREERVERSSEERARRSEEPEEESSEEREERVEESSEEREER